MSKTDSVSTMNMDFPNVRGIAMDVMKPISNNTEAIRKSECTQSLIHWASLNGLVSRNQIKLYINEYGDVIIKAIKFIPANKHLLHVPYKLDLSFNTLKYEVDEDKNWYGWIDLKQRIKVFESNFQWSDDNYDQKDNFSKNLLLIICIMSILKKIADINPNDFDNVSDTLKTFSYYWDALPSNIGSILYDWKDYELSFLSSTSFINSLPDAKRFGYEIFLKVFLPFIKQYPDKFITDIDYEIFMKVNSIVCTRSFAHSRKDKTALLPITDLVHGKSNNQHNCNLESCAIQKEVDGEFIKFHALTSTNDINAGDELFLEYPSISNGNYLLTYNTIPNDIEIIMNNQHTEIFLDLNEFLETELLRMFPNHPKIRKLKRDHIYGFFNLPKIIPMAMEDLFSSEYSCIPSIRQVLIFLLFNEYDTMKAIETSRIKSSLNPHQLHSLFLLFLRFIEISFGKPKLNYFRLLLSSNKYNYNISSLQQQQYQQESLSSASGTGSNTKTNQTQTSTVASTASAAIAAAGKLASSVVGSVVGSNNNNTTSTTTTTTINKTDEKQFQLTNNIRSAIFLQMSERLVIEVMINRFINLFPENFHELGYSLMRDHLVSTEINIILEELNKPYIMERASQCMVCGIMGSMSKCSRCRKAYYCSATCQKIHWQYHKKVCRHINN